MPRTRTLIDEGLVGRLYRKANAERWGVTLALFAEALERSATQAQSGRTPAESVGFDLERYLGSLHLEDLALACACAAGHDAAWEHFILEFRPALYRAADAIDPSGGARELADSLYGELYGLKDRGGAPSDAVSLLSRTEQSRHVAARHPVTAPRRSAARAPPSRTAAGRGVSGAAGLGALRRRIRIDGGSSR